jgi:hypothetical protein
MEAFGIAPSAFNHRAHTRPSRRANQNAFLSAPKLLDAVGEKVILKLPVNHFRGEKQGDLAQGGKPPRRIRRSRNRCGRLPGAL